MWFYVKYTRWNNAPLWTDDFRGFNSLCKCCVPVPCSLTHSQVELYPALKCGIQTYYYHEWRIDHDFKKSHRPHSNIQSKSILTASVASNILGMFKETQHSMTTSLIGFLDLVMGHSQCETQGSLTSIAGDSRE